MIDRSASRKSLLRVQVILFLLPLLPFLWGATSTSDAPALRFLHVVETQETLGVDDEMGLAFPPARGALLVLHTRSTSGELQILDTEDESRDVINSLWLADAVNITLDVDDRVLLLDPITRELSVLLGMGDVERFDLSSLLLENPRGISADPETGRLYILDGDRILVVRPGGDRNYLGAVRHGHVSEIALPHDWAQLRGLAFDPETGHLHVYSPQTRELFELDLQGAVRAVRGLPKSEGHLRAMVFAPSRDSTDAPERTSLYLAADGRRPPQATEWTLHAAPEPRGGSVETLELVAREKWSRQTSKAMGTSSPAGSSDPTLIRTIDTWRFNPPSPDAAGIAYVSTSHSLLLSDSEVNEVDLYQGRNMFELTPGGSLFRTWDTTTYSDEPTGVAYNPSNGHIYISDDSARRVWIVDPREGAVYGDGNDSVTSLDTKSFGCDDPEGVAYSTVNGFLYIVDGINGEVYEVDPGPDGQFDSQGDIIRQFDTLSIGVTDPEGIAVNSATGNLYIVGRPTDEVVEATPAGTLVQVLDISAADPDKPAGLAFGPTSIDASQASLYIAARGVDNNKDPSENDGEIYEFALGDFDPGEGNKAPKVTARSDATVLVDETVALHATVEDDGLPDPPGAIQRTVWSQDSGPDEAEIDNPNAEDTTVSFPVMGSYVLRLTAFDGHLTSSDTVTLTVSGTNGEVPIEVRVAASSDDAEERGADVETTSSDLELTLEKDGPQIVGLRFRSVSIPQLANIESAWIQFSTDESSSETTSLTIAAEDTGDAATFLEADGNLSRRTVTSATASWSPDPWLVAGETGSAQRTGDLSAVVQEVVDRGDWSAGNDLAILITGAGTRVAESYDGSSDEAPLLHVEYSLGGGLRNLPPTVEAGNDQTIEIGESTSVSGSVSDDGLPDPPASIQSTSWSQVNGPPFATFTTPSALRTGVTFPSEGSYQLRLSAFDGEKTSADDLTVTVNPPPPPPGQSTVELRISDSSDDAEERSDLDMKLTSSDLEMTLEKGAAQVVGLRFHPLPIPPGARIDSAWVQFEVDEATSVETDLRIEAEDSANAPAFLDVEANLSERSTTGIFVDWQVPAWLTADVTGPDQKTPELRDVIDSVVNGAGWQSGNALVLLITGTGERVAKSFEGDVDEAPLLHVTYTVD
jgi:uncharacterized protein YjiK